MSQTGKSQPSQDKKPPTDKISLTPPRFNRQDYEEYTRLMKKLKIGIPILKPCPTVLRNSAVIGDVGYMKDGEFFKVYNIRDMGHTVPLCKWVHYPSTGEESSGMTAISSSKIGWSLLPADDKDTSGGKSRTRQATVTAGMGTGVALFPFDPFQLESMEQKSKQELQSLMKGQVERWSRLTGLAKNDLLLVHSRIMSAAWVMMRSKNNIQKEFNVTMEGKSLKVAFFEPNPPDFACEWDVDTLTLSQDPELASLGEGSLVRSSLIRTSNCVFLGVFRMSGRDVLDTAESLVVAGANAGAQAAGAEDKRADVGDSEKTVGKVVEKSIEKTGKKMSKAKDNPPSAASGPSST